MEKEGGTMPREAACATHCYVSPDLYILGTIAGTHIIQPHDISSARPAKLLI